MSFLQAVAARRGTAFGELLRRTLQAAHQSRFAPARAVAPPVFCVMGAKELMLGEGRAFMSEWFPEAEFKTIPGARHISLLYESGTRETVEAMKDVAAFMGRSCGLSLRLRL